MITDIAVIAVLGIASLSIIISYFELAKAATRALNIRTRNCVHWLLVALLAVLWPVTAPVLLVYDFTGGRKSRHIFMGQKTWERFAHAQVGAEILEEESEIRRVHAEWQARVNYFYALGAEAEKSGDWLAGERVADNLEFLLETEPPRPPEKVEKRKVIAAPVLVTAQPVSPPRPKATPRVEIPETYFCNVCASHLAKKKFEVRRIAGICDPCYTEIHKGDE